MYIQAYTVPEFKNCQNQINSKNTFWQFSLHLILAILIRWLSVNVSWGVCNPGPRRLLHKFIKDSSFFAHGRPPPEWLEIAPQIAKLLEIRKYVLAIFRYISIWQFLNSGTVDICIYEYM